MKTTSPNFLPLLRAALAYYNAQETIGMLSVLKQTPTNDLMIFEQDQRKAKAREQIKHYLQNENAASKSRIKRIRRAIGYFIAGK